MKKPPLIVANWKMYKTSSDAAAFILAIKETANALQRKVFIAPAFNAIESAVAAASDSSIVIGAQNMHDAVEGAFTGEVSAKMLKASGAEFVILGHSERRQHFGETDAFIHRKIKRALSEELMPILCIGEDVKAREEGVWKDVLSSQLHACLKGLSGEELKRVAIAYEPIWAIGTGKNATPEIAQETHRFIRVWLAEHFASAQDLYLLYGGSVKAQNCAALMEQTDVDGVLVGGASLEIQSFSAIINF